jgi:ADP-ribose pyrophosphatase YjhB (NUDIX family)
MSRDPKDDPYYKPEFSPEINEVTNDFVYKKTGKQTTGDAIIVKPRGDSFDVLLIERKRGPHQGGLALPGGFKEGADSVEDFVAREALEETGLTNKDIKETIDLPTKKNRFDWDVRFADGVDVSGKIFLVDDSFIPIAGDDAVSAKFVPVEDIVSGKVDVAFLHSEWIYDTSKKLNYSGAAEVQKIVDKDRTRNINFMKEINKKRSVDNQPLMKIESTLPIGKSDEQLRRAARQEEAKNRAALRRTNRSKPKDFEVSTRGDVLGRQFSALNAKFKTGIYKGRTIEDVFQNSIKKSGKGRPPSKDSILFGKDINATKQEYQKLWAMWAKENPGLMRNLQAKVDEGFILKDSFAGPNTANQAEALTNILKSNTNNFPLTKIVSGLQKNVDQYGIEAAKELGIDYGGTVNYNFPTTPEGNNSPNFDEFKNSGQWEEIGGSYPDRTKANVLNSDATVWFGDTSSRGYTATQRHIGDKPFLVNPTAKELNKFIRDNNIKTLNVAGNRSRGDENLGIKAKNTIIDAVKNEGKIPSGPGTPSIDDAAFDDIIESKNGLPKGLIKKVLKAIPVAALVPFEAAIEGALKQTRYAKKVPGLVAFEIRALIGSALGGLVTAGTSATSTAQTAQSMMIAEQMGIIPEGQSKEYTEDLEERMLANAAINGMKAFENLTKVMPSYWLDEFILKEYGDDLPEDSLSRDLPQPGIIYEKGLKPLANLYGGNR